MAKISIDFSDVKAPSFSTVHQAPGVYNAEIAGVDMTKTKSDNTDMLVFAIVAGPGRYPYYCKIVPNQLWKLRELIEAAGTRVPNKVVQIDPAKYVGAKINVELEDDTYNGKLRSRVARVAPFSEVSPKAPETAQDSCDVEDDFGEFDDIL
jgi:hypothetical protein|nr:MAG TPA: Protein of unknown function (DUF669) [Caudoviricetes sp.]